MMPKVARQGMEYEEVPHIFKNSFEGFLNINAFSASTSLATFLVFLFSTFIASKRLGGGIEVIEQGLKFVFVSYCDIAQSSVDSSSPDRRQTHCYPASSIKTDLVVEVISSQICSHLSSDLSTSSPLLLLLLPLILIPTFLSSLLLHFATLTFCQKNHSNFCSIG